MFRAIWPVTDETVPWNELMRAAKEEIPSLAAQAAARLTGPGRFSIAASLEVPGSGRTTESVLVFEAPATAINRRSYRRSA